MFLKLILIDSVPINGGAVSPEHIVGVAVVMVPALEITFSITVILVTTLLQLATPVEASTSIHRHYLLFGHTLPDRKIDLNHFVIKLHSI